MTQESGKWSVVSQTNIYIAADSAAYKSAEPATDWHEQVFCSTDVAGQTQPIDQFNTFHLPATSSANLVTQRYVLTCRC